MSVMVKVYVPEDVAVALDEARGLATRSAWVGDLIARHLDLAPAGARPVSHVKRYGARAPEGQARSKRRSPPLRGGGGGGGR